MDIKAVPYQPGVPLREGQQLSAGVSKIILFLLSLIKTSQNFSQIQLKSFLNTGFHKRRIRRWNRNQKRRALQSNDNQTDEVISRVSA